MDTRTTCSRLRKQNRRKEQRSAFCAAAAGKLWSGRGETITEVLVALLVAALGILLFVGMVIAAGRITRQSESSYGKYIAARTAIEERSAGSSRANAKVTFTPAETGPAALEEHAVLYRNGQYMVYDPEEASK